MYDDDGDDDANYELFCFFFHALELHVAKRYTVDGVVVTAASERTMLTS